MAKRTLIENGKAASEGTAARRHAGTKSPRKRSRPRSRKKVPPGGGAPAPAPGNRQPKGGVGASNVQRIAVAKLNAAPYNPRVLLQPGDPEWEKLKRSIATFGYVEPIVWNKRTGHVVGGHQRLNILIAEHHVKTVDVVVVDLPGAEEKALNVALNKISGRWDEQLLAEVLADLQNDDSIDELLAGFDLDEIDAIIAQAGESGDGSGGGVAEDEPPEPLAEPVGGLGDLWVMGRHRVLCGDSTNAADVQRLMAGEQAGLCFTSPPYAQQRDYTKRIEDWDALMRGVFALLPMANDGQVLVNLGLIHRDNEWQPYWANWIEWMRTQGWRRFGWYVWDQGFGLPGNWNGRFGPSHEWVFHFNKEAIEPYKCVDKKPENIKPRNKGESTMRRADGTTAAFTNPGASGQPTKIPDSIIRVTRQVGSDGHPAQFPVGLPSFIVQCWPGITYEPFLGSGTTLIAAEQLGRICYGIEIEPLYVGVTIRRWMALTGGEAVRESDGMSWSAIAARPKKKPGRGRKRR